jgi:DNA invertase Pin-like site-specific DNA recombinase
MTRPRVAIYRRSNDHSGGGTRLRRQQEECRAYALERGWAITTEYVDNDTSSRATQPAFAELVKDARARRITHLVLAAADRIPRLRGARELCEIEGLEIHAPEVGKVEVTALRLGLQSLTGPRPNPPGDSGRFGSQR